MKLCHRNTTAARMAPLALAGVLLAGAALAQPRPPQPPKAPQAPRVGGPRQELQLTPQQRRELRKIALDQAIANADTRAALQKSRLEIARLMSEDRPDAAALDRKAAQVGELQGKLLRARLDAGLKMRALLTVEQREKMGPMLMRHLRGGMGHDGRRGMRRIRTMRGGPGPEDLDVRIEKEL